MTKFSSFKDQQLITESWRNYNNISEAQVEPSKPNTEKLTGGGETKPESFEEKPEQKDLQSFQNKQAQMTTVNPQVIAQKIIGYLKTLKGFDIQKNQAVVTSALQIVNKSLAQPQKPATPQAQSKPQQEPEKPAQPVKESSIYEGAHLDDGTLVCEACLEELLESQRTIIQEAKYQGRTVTLNKPTKGDVKKFKVYVKDPKTGNVKKVNFGDPNMKIKKNIPARRKSFRARHHCENPGPKTKARYWSCRKW